MILLNQLKLKLNRLNCLFWPPIKPMLIKHWTLQTIFHPWRSEVYLETSFMIIRKLNRADLSLKLKVFWITITRPVKFIHLGMRPREVTYHEMNWSITPLCNITLKKVFKHADQHHHNRKGLNGKLLCTLTKFVAISQRYYASSGK